MYFDRLAERRGSQVYTTGPGPSLSNFEVHLRNRKHREKVKERLRQ